MIQTIIDFIKWLIGRAEETFDDIVSDFHKTHDKLDAFVNRVEQKGNEAIDKAKELTAQAEEAFANANKAAAARDKIADFIGK